MPAHKKASQSQTRKKFKNTMVGPLFIDRVIENANTARQVAQSVPGFAGPQKKNASGECKCPSILPQNARNSLVKSIKQRTGLNVGNAVNSAMSMQFQQARKNVQGAVVKTVGAKIRNVTGANTSKLENALNKSNATAAKASATEFALDTVFNKLRNSGVNASNVRTALTSNNSNSKRLRNASKRVIAQVGLNLLARQINKNSNK